MIWLSVVLAGFISYLLFVAVRQYQINKLCKDIPNLPGDLPIVGLSHKMFFNYSNIFQYLFTELLPVSKRTYKFHSLHIFTVVLQSPEDIQTVLTSPHCINKSGLYTIFNISYGDQQALIVSRADDWQRHRRLLNSSFNTTRLKESIAIACQVSKSFVEDFEENIGNEIDVHKFSLRRSMDINLREHYEIEFNHQDLDSMAVSLEDMFIVWRKFFVVSELLPLHKIVQFLNRNNLLRLKIHEHTDYFQQKVTARLRAEMISKYREEFIRDGVETEEDIGNRPEKVFKKLCRLLHHGMIEDVAFEEEMIQFFGAGYTTVSASLSMLILALAIHPEIQENLYEEIMSVIPGDIESIDLDTLTKLPYFDRVVKENHRRFPSANVISRTNSVPIKLKEGTIPANTKIFIPIINMHLNPCHWGPDVDQFNPDRFLPENYDKLPRNIYLPFSLGKRNCIAGRFADVFIKIAVINLLKKFRLKTHLKMSDLRFDCYITTKLVSVNHLVAVERRL